MGTTSDKLTYLSGTKDKLKTTINYTGANITNDTFRSYPEKLYNEYIDIINNGTGTLYSNMPKVNGQGDSITLNDTADAPMTLDLKGNTSQASEPTPTSPQDIHVVSGDNTIEICGKNLFDGIFRQGNRYTTGLTDTTRIFTTQNYHVKSGVSYTISTTLDSSTYKYAINLATDKYPIENTTAGNAKQFYDSGWLTSGSFTFTPSQDGYLGIVVATPNGSGSITPSSISSYTWQLEKGSTASEYEAYTGQSQLISLGSIELCKIGTYQDKIYKDNGKWYLHKEIGKVVLDGSETWAYDTTYKYFRCPTFNFGDDIPSTEESGRTTQMNTHFKLETSWATFRNSTTVNMIGFISNEGYKVFLRNVDYTTTTDFSNWLVNNNIPIYYVLATPTNTEITDSELLEQLEALKSARSYDTSTHITQNANDKPFIITASAIKEYE